MYPYFDLVVGFAGHMILRTMLAGAQLLVGSSIQENTKVMIQTKMDTMKVKVEGWAWD